MAARTIHAALVLLDRQLVDREGRLCGKVDDVELGEPDDQGHRYVTGLLTGPGALLQRMERHRLGSWLRREVVRTFPSRLEDPGRVPIANVADIGNHVTLSLDAQDLATNAGERWVRDHIVGHLPGSRGDEDR